MQGVPHPVPSTAGLMRKNTLDGNVLDDIKVRGQGGASGRQAQRTCPTACKLADSRLFALVLPGVERRGCAGHPSQLWHCGWGCLLCD